MEVVKLKLKCKQCKWHTAIHCGFCSEACARSWQLHKQVVLIPTDKRRRKLR